MNKILIIAKREYFTLVKTKAFLISVFILPIFMGVIMVLPTLLVNRGAPDVTINVVDQSGQLFEHLAGQIEIENKTHNQKIVLKQVNVTGQTIPVNELERLKQEVRDGDYYALLVLSPTAISDGKGSKYFTMHSTDFSTGQRLLHIINEFVITKRFREHNLDEDLILTIQQKVEMPVVDLAAKDEAEADQFSRFVVPFVFCYLLFLGSVISGQLLLTSTIEEKSSRIIEVILSSASAAQIMIGKVLGIGGVMLSLILLYGCAGIAAAWKAELLNMIQLSPGVVCFLLAYYMVGFLMIASLYTAIGAACNDLKEAQALITPVTMLLVLPIVLSPMIIQHPSTPIAVVLSYIPPFSPFVMIMRMGADPTLSVVAGLFSLVIMVASLGMLWWAAAKIFRIGILMYGKPPKLRELLRWIRAS